MAVIRPTESRKAYREPVAFDLGDLKRRAEQLQADARASAEQILAEARAERERILAGAHETGHAEGREAGQTEGLEAGRSAGREEALAEAKREAAELVGAWTAALDRFEAQRDAVLLDTREHVIRFAAELAARVTKRALEVEPDRVADQIEHALALVLRPTHLVVSVHPDDAALAGELLPDLAKRLHGNAHAELATDAALDRGSCVVRTDQGEVDASIAGQLDRIARALLPDPAPDQTPDAPAESGAS